MSGKGDYSQKGKGQGDENGGRTDPGSETEIDQGWGRWSATGLQQTQQMRREGKGTKGGMVPDPWRDMTAYPEPADAGKGLWKGLDGVEPSGVCPDERAMGNPVPSGCVGKLCELERAWARLECPERSRVGKPRRHCRPLR